MRWFHRINPGLTGRFVPSKQVKIQEMHYKSTITTTTTTTTTTTATATQFVFIGAMIQHQSNKNRNKITRITNGTIQRHYKIIIIYLLTYSLHGAESLLRTNRFPASQEIPGILWNP
jgi:uncharacterized protein YcfJ